MFKKTHKHHIKPRHMGGTDESANLIELSVEEHAEAHFKLYEKYGKEQDFIAWKMLSGQITTDQARRMAASVVMKQKTGILNSQFGSKWFNNGLVEKKFRVGEKPPVDWVSGRMKKPPSRIDTTPWNKGRNDYITVELRESFGNGWRGKENKEQSSRMVGKKYHEGFKHTDESRAVMSMKKLGNKNRAKK